MELCRTIENENAIENETMKKWDTGMGGSRTMEKIGYRNGRIPNNEKNRIREWEGPEQWKKWDSGMGGSRTMEKMGYGNRTVPNNGKYGNREWNSPEE